jgi:hypothetical protein
MLAGLTRAEAAYHVPELMAAALSELGLDFYPPGSRSGQEAAVRALAGQAVSGSLTPQTLAAAVRQHFGHRLPLAERLTTLDDEYDLGDYATMTSELVDEAVMAEARQLTREQDGLHQACLDRHTRP